MSDLAQSNKSSQYWLDGFTHLAFWVLVGMAFWFYQERLFSDTGYYIAKVIHHEQFHVEHSRWVLAFSEWLPLLGLKLGGSIKLILILYSIGHVLFFYLCYLATRYIYQCQEAGLLLLGAQVLGLQYGYFAPGFELYYGMGFLTLFSVILTYGQKGIAQVFFLVFLAGMAYLSHPTTLPMLLGILGWHFYRQGWGYFKTYLIIIFGLALIILYKQWNSSSYESDRVNFIVNNMMNPSFLDASFLASWLQLLWERYSILILIFLATLVYLIYQRAWLLILGFIVLTILMQYLGMLAYPNIAEHTRYQEQCYYPMVFVIIYLMIMDILPKLKGQSFGIGAGIMLLLIGYKMVDIYTVSDLFVQRSQIMHRLIDKAQTIEGNKFFVYQKNAAVPGLLSSWSYPIETMLLSKVKPDQKTVTICYHRTFKKGNSRLLVAPNQFVFRLNEVFEDNYVNSHYFELGSGIYQPLNGRPESRPKGKQLAKLDELRKGVQVKVNNWSLKPHITKKYSIPITLINQLKQPLNSQRIYLAARWYQGDELIQESKNALALDISGKHNQDLHFSLPKKGGKYRLEIGLLVANRYWEWLDVGESKSLQF